MPQNGDFLRNNKYVIFVFLEYQVLLQSLKNILTVDPEICHLVFWACLGSFFDLFDAATGTKFKTFITQEEASKLSKIQNLKKNFHKTVIVRLAAITGGGRRGGRTKGKTGESAAEVE